jgi:integrase/recombinase XerC
MRLQEAIAGYVEHIRHERNLAATTCKHYASWLHGFTDWLSANGYPADPDLDTFNALTLRRYQLDKAKQGARPRTIHSAFHALRGMGEYLVEMKVIPENPCKQLKMPKKDAAVRHILTDADVTALFDACRRQRTPRQQALSRAVMAVLAYGALRREEACSLLVDDVNLADKSLLVRSGKGSKSRRVFICSEGMTAIREWLAVREKESKHPYLFSIDIARRLHHRGIATLIDTLAAIAGIADNPAAKPHSLRHWAATNLLRNGANIRDVSQFLGHSDLQTTCRYLHSNEEQLRSISELTALRPQTTSKPQPATNRPALRVIGARGEESARPRRRRIARG